MLITFDSIDTTTPSQLSTLLQQQPTSFGRSTVPSSNERPTSSTFNSYPTRRLSTMTQFTTKRQKLRSLPRETLIKESISLPMLYDTRKSSSLGMPMILIERRNFKLTSLRHSTNRNRKVQPKVDRTSETPISLNTSLHPLKMKGPMTRRRTKRRTISSKLQRWRRVKVRRRRNGKS